jgi:cAMP-specific phosphodiesterase 4
LEREGSAQPRAQIHQVFLTCYRSHANEYGFTNEVIHLSQFLVETVIQARVQFFNPLLIADKIQDLGISFVRISRYLLVEGIKKALEMHYRVEKEQTFSQEDVVKGTNKKKFVRIDIKDQHPIVLIIQDMDLTNVYEQHIFSDVDHPFDLVDHPTPGEVLFLRETLP